MNVFGMVSTRSSVKYTGYALDTFFEHTALSPMDDFYLIDNDRSLGSVNHPEVKRITWNQPRSFAHNVNVVMDRAKTKQADLYFINNDIIFTKNWINPLLGISNALVSPLSNQQVNYGYAGFQLRPCMDLEDYLPNKKEFKKLVELNTKPPTLYTSRLTIPFFCIKIPYEVYNELGPFDETFGMGGAEDTDYCLRAAQKGIPLLISQNSLVLHFQGKSTWRGAETPEETKLRNRQYIEAFDKKWGVDIRRKVIG